MRINRRLLATAALALAAALATSAQAAKTLRIAHLNPEGPTESHSGAMTAVFKALVETATNGEIIVEIATKRGAASDSHPAYRAKVRTLFSNWQGTINAGLTNLILLDCVTSGATPEIRADDHHDVSTLRYRTPFAIRYDAWPN